MKKLRSYMFEESARSMDESGLVGKIVKFLIVFVIIMIFESIVPTIMALGPMMDEYRQIGVFTGEHEVSVAESVLISTRIAALPKVMIPALFSTIFGTAISVIYVRSFEIRRASSMGAVKSGILPQYLIGAGVGILLISAIEGLSLLTGACSVSTRSSIDIGLVFLYLLGFFIQGMSEEFIFRGYLMTSVGGKYPAAAAIAVSSIAFGLAHAANPGFGVLPMINLVLFGIFAALYMIHTGNIWGVSAIHTLWNFTQGNVYGISVSGSGSAESLLRTEAVSTHAFLTGGNFGIEGSIFTTVVLAAGIAAVIFLYSRNPEKSK